MRSLLATLALAALAAPALSAQPANALRYTILCPADPPQCAYAARSLRAPLESPSVRIPGSGAAVVVEFRIDSTLGGEAFALEPHGRHINIAGGDARGLIYGALELREQLLNGTPIDKLESEGLAKRRPHPQDRRAREVSLTPKGRRLLQRARKIAFAAEHEVLRGLTAAERRELLRLLRRAFSSAPPQPLWSAAEGE